MDQDIRVHSRVMERHPEISEVDVREAWSNFARRQRRGDGKEEYFIAVGFDRAGRPIEMVALQTVDGGWFVYHALTPPTKSIMAELGLMER